MFSRALKMKSSSSSSSENTPLLNGSQEGPCYAYSYNNSREEDDEEDEEKDDSTESNMRKDKLYSILGDIKTCIFVLVVIFCAICLSFVPVKDPDWYPVAIIKGHREYINVTAGEVIGREIIHLRIKGPFNTKESGSTSLTTFTLKRITSQGMYEKISDAWIVLLAPDIPDNELVLEHDFLLPIQNSSTRDNYQLIVATNEKQDYVSLLIELTAKHKQISRTKIIMAFCVLISLHLLLAFELLPKVLASMLATAVAISCLVFISERPPLQDVASWIDMEMLSLIFGMNLLVSTLCETGFFEFVAVLVYKVTGGHMWSLFTALCFVTAILSICFDSLTTLILMTALTIRLCEAMNIDPKHILIALIIFSNIGSAVGYSTFTLNGYSIIGYSLYTLHMFPVILLSLIISFIFWWFNYRNIEKLRFEESLEVVEVQHEQEVWRKAYHSLSNYSREEECVKVILKRKISALETLLMKKLYDSKIEADDYRTSLKELTHTLKVKKRCLLYKSCIVTFSVLTLLLLRNVPQWNINSGWIVVLGAICLLILDDFDRAENVFNRVEWSTLLLLACLCVFSKVLVKLEFVDYLVNKTLTLLNDTDENYRLLISIVFLLWFSALSSTLFIPFPAVMMEILRNSGNNFNPLVFAVSLGACLGGNGSLLGSYSNVLVTGLAEQHGQRFSYFQFFKIGFPIMLLTTATAMIHLLICHVWLHWSN